MNGYIASTPTQDAYGGSGQQLAYTGGDTGAVFALGVLLVTFGIAAALGLRRWVTR